MRVLRFLRASAMALVLAGSATAAAAEIRLTLPEARGTAARFLMEGRPDAALMLAEGVLLGAPGDVEALLLKSRALRDLGRTDEAGSAARAALNSSTTAREEYFAALAMAQAKSSGRQGLVAQYWLRRAADVAPDDHLRATAINDFRLVRRITPARLRLSLSVNPSDNLNDAPRGEVMYWGPFVNQLARPLSGVETRAQVDYSYRIALSENARITLGALYQMQRVSLSGDARATDPTAKNRDFAVDVLGVSAGYERRAADSRWLATAQLSQMRVLLAGDPLSDITRLDLSYGRALGETLTGTVSLGFERETRLDQSLPDADSRDIGLSLSRAGAHGFVKLSVSATDVMSASPVTAREETRAALSYHLAQPVLGLRPSLTVSYEETRFDRAWLPIWLDERRDAEWQVAVDATIPGWSFRGFAPEIGVSFRDRSSNYVPYESRGAKLKLGLKSVF